MSLASLSSVFSSIFSIDTLYWHSSTTTTSGCTARIVCVREGEQWVRKIRDRDRIRVHKRVRVERDKRQMSCEGGGKDKTKINVGKKEDTIMLGKIGMPALLQYIQADQVIITSRCYSTALLHIYRITPLFHWQFTAFHISKGCKWHGVLYTSSCKFSLAHRGHILFAAVTEVGSAHQV